MGEPLWGFARKLILTVFSNRLNNLDSVFFFRNEMKIVVFSPFCFSILSA